MVKNFFTFIVLFFSSVIIFVSSGCETTPVRQAPLPDEPVAHFPKMIVGDSWVYTAWSRKYGIDIYTSKIIEVELDGSYTREIKSKKAKKTRIRNYGSIGQQINPPTTRKTLNFPLFVGKKWSDKHTGRSTSGSYHTWENDYIVKKYETVNTEAGPFKAFKIFQRQHNVVTGWMGTNEYWYSPEAKFIVMEKPTWRKGIDLISYKLALADRPPKIEKPKIIIKGERVKIGILEFQSLNEEAKKDNLGKIISEMLTTSFVNSEAFKIIEREQLQKIIKEFKLSQSGIIDTSHAKQIGKMAGADAIVTGSVTKIGNDLRLDARIIDVESGIILTAEKSEGKVDLRSIGMMTDRIVAKLVNKFYKAKR